jgi:hypothetical protein
MVRSVATINVDYGQQMSAKTTRTDMRRQRKSRVRYLVRRSAPNVMHDPSVLRFMFICSAEKNNRVWMRLFRDAIAVLHQQQYGVRQVKKQRGAEKANHAA